MTTSAMPTFPARDTLARGWGRRAVIGVPMAFLLIFFFLPFLVVFKISVSEMDNVVFKDLVLWADRRAAARGSSWATTFTSRRTLFIFETYLNFD